MREGFPWGEGGGEVGSGGGGGRFFARDIVELQRVSAKDSVADI